MKTSYLISVIYSNLIINKYQAINVDMIIFYMKALFNDQN